MNPQKLSQSDGSAEFDSYAEGYDEALMRGLSLSGEDKDYFARGRVVWLAQKLKELGVAARTALDFGCGTGGSVPYLLDTLKLDSVLGVDVSARSVELARQEVADPRARFSTLTDYALEESVDLAFCNGVFHHIPPADRPAALDYVWRTLRPGGVFAFWENNPWNVGTRIIMKRVPFDRDAILLSSRHAQRLLRAARFEIVRTDFLFIFPRILRALRGIEPRLSGWPLGGQYLVLARKPAAG